MLGGRQAIRRASGSRKAIISGSLAPRLLSSQTLGVTNASTMAIWQFDLSLVPCGGPMPSRTSDGHESPSVGAERVVEAKAWLSARFGEPWEMLDGWLIYGPTDGSRVDLVLDQDGTAEIGARIDARGEATEFIGSLCELSELLDCSLFAVEFWQPIEAKSAAIAIALERSRVAAFIRDPKKVLKGAGSDA